MGSRSARLRNDRVFGIRAHFVQPNEPNPAEIHKLGWASNEKMVAHSNSWRTRVAIVMAGRVIHWQFGISRAMA
jgi:hypothetical protein